VDRRLGLAGNDIYCAFFHERMEIITNFCHQLPKTSLLLKFCAVDYLFVADFFDVKGCQFDRSHVTNISKNYIPLLESPEESPHATLLIGFMAS
jgi:hypothetical protein